MVRLSKAKVASAPTDPQVDDFPLLYPMHAMRVTDFLNLKALPAHQDALAQNLLVADREALEGNTIFVSHQWTAFHHPDPMNEQLVALQRAMRNLLTGESVVTSNWILKGRYHDFTTCDGAWWKERLPEMYIWLDYISMPQPLARRFRGIDPSGVAARMAALSSQGKGHAGQADHRAMGHAGSAEDLPNNVTSADDVETEKDVAALADQLTAAVESIPAYISSCLHVWVLAPPINHVDVDDHTCNFGTWRQRGWCRMEFIAAKLTAGRQTQVMVIDGHHKDPYFVNPCDSIKLSPRGGEMSVEADRTKVMSVVSKMYDAKLAAFRTNYGDLLAFRIGMMMRATLTEPFSYTAAEQAVSPAEAVERVKRRIFWRDDVLERRWLAAHGHSLLLYAIALNDVPAAKALLALPDAVANLKRRVKPPYTNRELRERHHLRDHFVTLVIQWIKGATCHHVAVGLAGKEMLELVLAHEPSSIWTKRQHGLMTLPMHHGEVAKYQMIRDSQGISLENLFSGTPDSCGSPFANWLHTICSRVDTNGEETLKFVLEQGLLKDVNRRTAMFGMTPLAFAATNPEADAHLLTLLCEYGANPNKKVRAGLLLRVLAKLPSFAPLGHYLKHAPTAPPLFHSAQLGDVPKCEALLKAGADPKARDQRGRLYWQLAEPLGPTMVEKLRALSSG